MVPGIRLHIVRLRTEYTMATVVELGECGWTEKRCGLDGPNECRQPRYIGVGHTDDGSDGSE